jgi:translocator protein
MTAEPSGVASVATLAIASVCVVALLGGLATEIGPWYRGLAKPSWQPPDWLFGPAWTVIFGFIAAAGTIAWRTAPDAHMRRMLAWLFAINAALNVLWSILFFKLRRPDWALIEVVFLWLSILALIVCTNRWSRRAALLLVPYLAWVTFAGVLNGAVVRLNAPF